MRPPQPSRPVLYGPSGAPLAAPGGQPSGRAAILKAFFEAWLTQAVAGDAALGRGPHNYAADPATMMPPAAIKRFHSIGVRVYVGSGNIFLADLTGSYPRVVQRRPLAQRYVEIVPEGEGG